MFSRNHCRDRRTDRRHELGDFIRPEEISARRIGDQHFSGTKSLPLHNLLIGKIRDANFGADDEQSIRCQRVAQRTQSVTIELCAYEISVGKDQGSRTIPRFLLGCAVGEELAQPRVQMLIMLPCWRYQAQCRLSNAGTASHQRFESIIKTRGITHPRLQKIRVL